MNVLLKIAIFLTLLSTLTQGQQDIKVGFIYIGEISDFGWNFAHDNGRVFLSDHRPQVVTRYKELIPEDDAAVRAAVQEWIDDDYDLIVGTSFGYQFELQRVAQEALTAGSKLKIAAATGFLTESNMVTTFGRIYQARYLTGLLAGSMLDTNIAVPKVCYIAAFSFIPEVTRGINAFAIGLAEARPTAELHVYFINSWSNRPLESLGAETCFNDYPDAEVITLHADTLETQIVAKNRGKFSVGYNSDMRIFVGESVLSSPLFNWGPLYVDIVDRIINPTTWVENDQIWLGFPDGIVDIAGFSNRVDRTTKNLVQSREAELIAGTFDVFCGVRLSNVPGSPSPYPTPDPGTGCLNDSVLLGMGVRHPNVVLNGDIVLPPRIAHIVEWGSGAGAAFVTLTVISMVIVLAMLVATILKRTHPAIQTISSSFVIMMEIAGLIALISVFMWLGDPNTAKCNARIWLIVISFTLLFGALFTKTWRIFVIFRGSKKISRVVVTDLQLFAMVGGLLALDIIVLICFVAIPGAQMHGVVSENVLIEDGGFDWICSSEHAKAFAITLVILKGILVLTGVAFSYLTRKVDKKYKEAKEIATVVYSVFFVNVVILPLLFFLNMTVEIRFVLVALDILWVVLSSLLLLFAKRLYQAFTVESSEWVSSFTTSSRVSGVRSNMASSASSTKD